MEESKKRNRLSYTEMKVSLVRNGWTPIGQDRHEKYSLFKMYFGSSGTTVRISLLEDPLMLELGDSLGVNIIELCHKGLGIYFDASSLNKLQEAISTAEENLLTIGIPFGRKYTFNTKKAARIKRRNNSLRKKFNLDSAEIKAYKDILRGEGTYSPEDIDSLAEDYLKY